MGSAKKTTKSFGKLLAALNENEILKLDELLNLHGGEDNGGGTGILPPPPPPPPPPGP